MVNVDNIDRIAKTDSSFPTPESQTFCVVDGYGYSPDYMVEVFNVKETIAKVFEAVEPVKFYPLFMGNVREVPCFKVPPLCHIRQQYRRQIISRDGIDLIELRYDRDYDRLRFDFRLLGELKDLTILNSFEWNGLHGADSRYRFTPSDPWVTFGERSTQFPEVLKVAFRENLVRVLKALCF